MEFFISSIVMLSLALGLASSAEIRSRTPPAVELAEPIPSYANLSPSDKSLQDDDTLDLKPPSGPVLPYSNLQNFAEASPEEENYPAETTKPEENKDMDIAETIWIGPPSARYFGWGGHRPHWHYRPSHWHGRRCYWSYGRRYCV